MLISHEKPDGDTIGATLALAEFLKLKNKNVKMVSSHGVPKVFRYLDNWQDFQTDFLVGDFDVIILIDNGDLKRTGYLERILQARAHQKTIINIDHHPKNDIWKIADLNLVDETASSTCQIIYQIFKLGKVPITSQVATMILSGVYTDTGGFQHSNSTPDTLAIVSDLLSSGAKLKDIRANISNSKSVTMLKLWGLVLERIVDDNDLGLVYSVVTQKDMQSCGALDEDLAGVVNLMAGIPGESATMLIYETVDGKIKGSLRTESDRVDVAKIAELFGGGGHRKAAGFAVEGKLKKLENGWEVE